MTTADLPDFKAWLGRRRVELDVLSLSSARGLAATLDREPQGLALGQALPAGWHWAYFHPAARRSALGSDGHEKRGEFLPPIPLPRRMWAGGSLRFSGDLRLGEEVQRTSTIQSIEAKEGRSGPLVFVTVRHEIRNGDGAFVEEEQDLVYRTPPPTSRRGSDQPVGNPLPADCDWSESYVADEVTLFRFSALTFNGHRIHYDHPYTTEVEGYPGLVVHGPLLALLLLDGGLRNWGGSALEFRYRALSPLFASESFSLAGRRTGATPRGRGLEPRLAVNLWAAHPERGLAMEAGLRLSE